MLVGKHVIDWPWRVFQYGHFGWCWTDDKSIIRGQGYKNIITARQAQYAYANQLELKPADWPEARQCAPTGLAGYLVRGGVVSDPPPAKSRKASRGRRGRGRATTSATHRAGKRAKGSTKSGGNVRGKASC